MLSSKGQVYVVDLKAMTCGCRKWDLSGIPCKHVLVCLAERGWEVHRFVDKAYTVATYRKQYKPAIVPINGKVEWVQTKISAP